MPRVCFHKVQSPSAHLHVAFMSIHLCSRRLLPQFSAVRSTRIRNSFITPRIHKFTVATINMSEIKTISTDKAAKPAGPYSQGKMTSNLIFVSGQIPATPSGELVEGSIAERTAACIRAVQSVLEAAGSSLDKVLKVQVFLTDMADFAEMNSEYEKWFTSRPARSCVAVHQLPKGVNVEIECIAVP